MILPFLIGTCFYCLSVWLSYSTAMKATSWYFPLGLMFALICNAIWLYIAKTSPSKNDTYLNGLLWDSIIVGAYAIIPVLFYGVRFTSTTLVGILLIIAGLILTKV